MNFENFDPQIRMIKNKKANQQDQQRILDQEIEYTEEKKQNPRRQGSDRIMDALELGQVERDSDNQLIGVQFYEQAELDKENASAKQSKSSEPLSEQAVELDDNPDEDSYRDQDKKS